MAYKLGPNDKTKKKKETSLHFWSLALLKQAQLKSHYYNYQTVIQTVKGLNPGVISKVG